MEIIFLGTSGAIPTVKRNHTAIFLRYENEGILVDCGEGTQRQFAIARISPTKITRLLITHWHGDHVLGIPGLLQTLAFSNYSKELKIYGPEGTGTFISNVLKSFRFISKIKFRVYEIIKEGKIIDEKKFSIFAFKLKHQNTFGYRFEEKDKRKIKLNLIKKFDIPQGPLLKRFQEGKSIKWKGRLIKAEEVTQKVKGKAIAFVFDTAYCKNAIKLSKDADIAILESTFLSKDEKEMDKTAYERDHLTAKQAAEIAKKSNVKKLYLTHISRRYNKKEDLLLKEAKRIFNKTYLAKDFMKIKL